MLIAKFYFWRSGVTLQSVITIILHLRVILKKEKNKEIEPLDFFQISIFFLFSKIEAHFSNS
jgi:hypothetical protein